MKFLATIFTVAVLVFAHSAVAQGFVNMDFEDAVVVPVSGNPGHIVASNAIPGWTAYLGVNPQSGIWYDTRSLGGAFIALEDSNANSGGGPLPIDGNYSIFLEGSTASTPTSAAISQTQTIPIGTQSLTFYGNLFGSIQVTFNGQIVPFSAIGSDPNYTIYGANISSFAGQTGQLQFSSPVNTTALLDDIQFSSSPVPEPSVFALSALGATVFAFRRWRKSRN